MNERLALDRFRAGRWRGWCARGWAEVIGAEPLSVCDAGQATVVRDRPAARTVRVQLGGEVVYVKHVRRLKDRTRGLGAWMSRVRWQLGPSRVFRVMRVIGRMEACGFAVPRLILAARRRRGSAAEELLITRACDGPSMVEAVGRAAGRAQREAVIAPVARDVARLHAAGFVHGDLLPGNLVLAGEAGRPVYLDNDRTHCRWFWRRWAQRRNLVQMVFRLRQAHGFSPCRLFLDRYYENTRLGQRRARRERLIVVRKARARARRAARK